jgi:hypothetical protein
LPSQAIDGPRRLRRKNPTISARTRVTAPALFETATEPKIQELHARFKKPTIAGDFGVQFGCN